MAQAVFLPQNPVDLRQFTKVAQGKNRDIYIVPGADLDPAAPPAPVVLKVPRYADRASVDSPAKRVLRRLLPGSLLRVIRKEAQYRAKLPEPQPIPAFLGYVDTSQGRAALWEAVCTRKGKLAPTLKSLAARGRVSEVVEPLNQFAKTCFEQNLVAPDINDRNLVLTKAGGKRVVLVDGFGDHRLFSLRGLSRAHNQRSLVNRFQKVARQMGLAFDPETRRFSLPG